MAEGFTTPIDGDGDDISREVTFLQQAGHIRIRDKAAEGERYVSLKSTIANHVECHPSHIQFDADQDARLEAHRRRILDGERLLTSKGINPCRMGTAGKFDRLVNNGG